MRTDRPLTIDTSCQAAILRSHKHRPANAFQILFYKNDDAITRRGWDDSPPRGVGRAGVIFHATAQGEDLQGKALQDFVIDKIDDLKGQDIIALNVQGKSSITDCMIICTGTSSRHVISIADHVVQESRAAGLMPLGIEGKNGADWIVVDLGDVIVHVMQDESRRLYELEKLWS